MQPSGPGCHTAPLALCHGRRRSLVSPPNCGQQLKSRGSAQGAGQASPDSSFLRSGWGSEPSLCRGSPVSPALSGRRPFSSSPAALFSTVSTNLSPLSFMAGTRSQQLRSREKIRCFHLSGTLSADCCGCLLSSFSPAASFCPASVCGLTETPFGSDCI